MKENKDKVSYNDIQTFKKTDDDKVEAIQKDPNSDYNSFISEDANEKNPSDPGNESKK